MHNSGSTYNITLSSDEALILFDWLARFSDGGPVAPARTDTAEERVFEVVQGQLQRQLIMPLDPNYKSFLAEARNRVLNR